MTDFLEDVYHIQNLKARYADAVDGGWTGAMAHDADAVVALFCEDGVWDSGAFGGGHGHEQIRTFMETGAAIMPFAFHHITCPNIEVAGETATGSWHAILAVSVEEGSRLHTGIYNDEFIKTPQGWKFRRLQFTLAATILLPAEWQVF